jgi:hypothetical protein
MPILSCEKINSVYQQKEAIGESTRSSGRNLFWLIPLGNLSSLGDARSSTVNVLRNFLWSILSADEKFTGIMASDLGDFLHHRSNFWRIYLQMGGRWRECHNFTHPVDGAVVVK